MKGNLSTKVVHLQPRKRPDTEPSTQQEETERFEYQEVVSAPSWMRIGTLGVFVLIVGFFLLGPFIREGRSDLIHLLLSVVFALSAWVVQLFLTLRISVSNKKVQFGFYLFTKEVPYRDILDCMVIRYKWTDFVGWGVRRGHDGCTMYSVPGDQQIAVKIVVMGEDNERKEFAFSAKRPQVICKKIQTHIYEMPDGTESKRSKRPDKSRKSY